MSFEDIPEDKEESYPCINCNTGEITMNEECTLWECDKCNWTHLVIPKPEET